MVWPLRVRGVSVDYELFQWMDGPSPGHTRVLGRREASSQASAWMNDRPFARDLDALFREEARPRSHAAASRSLQEAWLVEKIEQGWYLVAEQPSSRGGSAPVTTTVATPQGEAPVAKETLGWFEVTVVDPWGKPVSAVDLEFTYDGNRKKMTTPSSGKVHLADVAASFGSARIVNLKDVRQAVRARWGKTAQPTELPKGLENPGRVRLNAVDPTVSVENEAPSTIVLVKSLLRVRLLGMHFDTNKSFLRPAAMDGIQRVVTVYRKNPSGELLILGHTDRAGDEAYNLDLSVERAEAVKAYLKDDVAAWEAWFEQGKPAQKRWGEHEVRQMISALPCEQTTPGFQRWSNASRGTDLAPDGVAGPKTRKALIEAYMALDGTTLPSAIVPVIHGCGEYFPLSDAGDQGGKDGVAAQENRRVEMFCFDDEVYPPVPGEEATRDEPEYAQWQKQVTEEDDFEEAHKHHALRLVVVNEHDLPVPDLDLELTTAEGVVAKRTDGDGVVELKTASSAPATARLVDPTQLEHPSRAWLSLGPRTTPRPGGASSVALTPKVFTEPFEVTVDVTTNVMIVGLTYLEIRHAYGDFQTPKLADPKALAHLSTFEDGFRLALFATGSALTVKVQASVLEDAGPKILDWFSVDVDQLFDDQENDRFDALLDRMRDIQHEQ